MRNKKNILIGIIIIVIIIIGGITVYKHSTAIRTIPYHPPTTLVPPDPGGPNSEAAQTSPSPAISNTEGNQSSTIPSTNVITPNPQPTSSQTSNGNIPVSPTPLP